MIEPRLDPRLAEEPRELLVVGGHRRHPLDRDLAPDPQILRRDDRAHAAAPDRLAEHVARRRHHAGLAGAAPAQGERLDRGEAAGVWHGGCGTHQRGGDLAAVGTIGNMRQRLISRSARQRTVDPGRQHLVVEAAHGETLAPCSLHCPAQRRLVSRHPPVGA